MTDLTLSLGQIRGASPCADGWSQLLRHLGYADGQFDPSRRVTLGDIASSNGAMDAWWCVRCLDWDNITVRRAVIAALLPSVKRASSHTADARVHTYSATIRQWAVGDEAMDPQGSRAAAEAASQVAAWAVSWAVEAARATAAAAWTTMGTGTAAWKAMGAAAEDEREAQRRDLINTFGRTAS